MKMKRAVLIAGLALALLLGAQTHANAATTWSTGVKVSTAKIDVSTWANGSGCKKPPSGYGAIKFKGDYLFVRDNCADGRSAIVEWRDAKHPANRWICRNSKGSGTIVKCNFNFPETKGILIAGTSNGTKNVFRDHGASLYISKDGKGMSEGYPGAWA